MYHKRIAIDNKYTNNKYRKFDMSKLVTDIN